MCRKTNREHPWSVQVLLSLVLLSTPAYGRQDDGADFFEKKVRPLLAQHCYSCHSSASKPIMGGLSLDQETSLRQGGSRGVPIQPGDPDSSLLIEVVRYQDDKPRMPPAGKLSQTDIDILTQWVQMGAPWGAVNPGDQPPDSGFWAFQTPQDPLVPKVGNTDWVVSPIDNFILAELESKGLQPAPPADQRSLIRRATFDLTGLPPTPEEIDDFLSDTSEDAFSRLIDRLLNSPRYGERWGRHWLDVARYADSNGLDENLVYKNAFRYRDYVIEAYNKDKPYDQFIREQIAGDLMPDPGNLDTTLERWRATGFLSLGAKMLAEDDPVKMEMDIVDEQLDTTMRAFTGLTVGCARCHDHKFDPISINEYYGMAGIFKSSKTMEHFNVVAKWHEYVLAPEEDRERLRVHEEKIREKTQEISNFTKAENEKLIARGRSKVGSYLLAASDLLDFDTTRLNPVLPQEGVALPDGWVLRLASGFDRGNVNRELVKGKSNVPGKKDSDQKEQGPYFAEYDIEMAREGPHQIQLLEVEAGKGTADLTINRVLMKAGLEAIENRRPSPDAAGWSVSGIFPLSVGKNTIRLEHDSLFPYFELLLITPSPIPPGNPVPKTRAQSARQYDINPVFLKQWVERLRRSRGAIHSVLYRWHIFGSDPPPDAWASPASALFDDFKSETREDLARHYQDLCNKAVKAWEAKYGALEASKKETEAQDGTPAEGEEKTKKKLDNPGLEALRQVLYEKWGPFRPPEDFKSYYSEEVLESLSQLQSELAILEESKPDLPRAMGIREGKEIGDLPLHIRGSHWNLGEPIARGFLSFGLGKEQPLPDKTRSGRLQLAYWLTRKDHPLTGRVMANRIWRWHFGRGIVASTDNFGRLGEKPSHPELLDWLAVRFVENSWSIKQMHRLIMLSNTYQMSTVSSALATNQDPENRLLWRMNRRRLEAEAIRDAIMLVSSGLDLKMGGSLLAFKDREYVRRDDIDYDRNRRAVYLPVLRSSLYDFFRAFDFADPSVLNGDRGSSVIAPQALFMMNGSVVGEHSLRWADQLLEQAGLDDPGRIRKAYEQAFARPAEPGEIERALGFIRKIEHALSEREEDPRKRRLLAWQSFCRSLLASNEFVYLG